MKDPLKKDFALAKLKANNGGGLTVNYTVQQVKGSETYNTDLSHKNPREPHPDLMGRLDELKKFLAETLRLKEFLIVGRSSQFSARAKQLEALEAAWQELLESIKVKGISISGKDNNEGVIISGTMKTSQGSVVALNSPRLKFQGNHYGFEEELEEICKAIIEEAYEYVYKGKASQLEMFSDDGEEVLDGKALAANDA